MIHYKETDYGFEYGAARVERCCADEKHGWVVLQIKTASRCIDVYVTKGGRVRLWENGDEYTVEK